MTTLTQTTTNKYWSYALWLALFTIFYNLLEGMISVFFGINDETLTLFGFGVDSFIEVMSGIGILAMVLRIRQNPETPRSQFERTALRVTGTSFYLLAVGLAATAIYNLFTAHKPETTLPGLHYLRHFHRSHVGDCNRKAQSGTHAGLIPYPGRRELHDGMRLYVLVLLASSLIYEFTGFGFIDSIGALGLIYFSYSEGKESFEKAEGMEDPCDDEELEELK